MNLNAQAKRILCYSDSNTWGQVPGIEKIERHPSYVRWTGVLQSIVGNDYEVVEEGLCGRTTDITGTLKGDGDKNGLEHFAPIFLYHIPLDFLILYLGTNDLKERFMRSAQDIAEGAERIVQKVEPLSNSFNMLPPKILLLAPTPVLEEHVKPPYRMIGAQEKSLQFADVFFGVALRNKCDFMDLASITESSKLDGIHLESEAHQLIGIDVAKKIQSFE